MRRARSDAAKSERRAKILHEASRLLTERDLDELAMTDLATAAGVVKGTLYLYFPTKEGLFLELLEGELARWASAVEASIDVAQSERQGPSSVRAGVMKAEEMAAILVDQIVARPLLWRLLGFLHGVLERNIDVERAIAFKQRLMSHTSALASHLESTFGLSQPDATRFVLWFYASVVGFSGLAAPGRSAAEAHAAHPELRIFQVDLQSELTTTTTILLRGLLDGHRVDHSTSRTPAH